MMSELNVKPVSKIKFSRKMKDLSYVTRKEMEAYISLNSNEIHHFEYGHIPGIRIYKIILKNGKDKTWKLIRRD